MSHARMLLDGTFVTAALPDPIVTVVGAMRHNSDYTPLAGRPQPEEHVIAEEPHPIPRPLERVDDV
jgi:hypothetical protein